jgi:hydrogenase/urease accessory protein HupE
MAQTRAARTRRRTIVAGLAGAVAALLAPGVAHAHLVSTGFGPFYDGIMHLALTPEDLLTVIALALLGGLNGTRAGRLMLLALPLAWLAGGLLGLVVESPAALELASSFTFLLLGLLVALDRRLPLATTTGLATLFGLVHGFLNGSAMAAAGQGMVALLGIVAAVFIIVTLAAAMVVSLRVAWMRVAVRVAGSWIAAIGLLMLGWSFRQSM